MGDQIGAALEAALVYAPVEWLARVRSADVDRYARARLFADAARLNALYMIARAGSGHIGSSFSCLDIVSWLLLEELGPDDLYFSSKGHDAPGFYAALIGLGRLPERELHGLRRLSGLPGHPDVRTEGVVANTGSLGMGISKAKGMVLAHRALGEQRRVFVLTGDGELQEGQIWESLAGAVAAGMRELTVLVDHNKLQSDRMVTETSDLGDLRAKLESFGWHVERADGHDPRALQEALVRCKQAQGPQIVIADTIKGRGVSFMEHTRLPSAGDLYKFHSGAPDRDSYERAVGELLARIDDRARALGLPALTPVRIEHEVPQVAASARPKEKLIAAYGRALLSHAQRDPRIVALDADLMVDMGLLPFKTALPERFFEHGIAECDMVSAAGGMALRGLLPVCHSFACFLSPRPNEQMYTNATERTKVVYVGGLAGLLPAAPGHSHQGVRDISVLGAIPGLDLIQPSTEAGVEAAVAYALSRITPSCYLRLCSIPWALPFEPSDDRLERGCGSVIRPGRDATLVAYGPVMLSQAFLAAEKLATTIGLDVQVIDLPWLTTFDIDWLREVIGERRWLFTLDDHYVDGGQGERLAAALIETDMRVRVRRYGLRGIPECGAPDEVLRYHRLDAASLAEAIRREVIAGRDRDRARNDRVTAA